MSNDKPMRKWSDLLDVGSLVADVIEAYRSRDFIVVPPGVRVVAADVTCVAMVGRDFEAWQISYVTPGERTDYVGTIDVTDDDLDTVAMMIDDLLGEYFEAHGFLDKFIADRARSCVSPIVQRPEPSSEGCDLDDEGNQDR
jgi:hypothetical protein